MAWDRGGAEREDPTLAIERGQLDPIYCLHGAERYLVDRCVAGLQDPSYFVQHTGVPQDMPADLDGWEIGWAKPYMRRFPNANLSALLSKAPNLSYTTWGGLPPE